MQDQIQDKPNISEQSSQIKTENSGSRKVIFILLAIAGLVILIPIICFVLSIVAGSKLSEVDAEVLGAFYDKINYRL